VKYLLDTNIISAWAKRSSQAVLDAFLRHSPAELATSSLVEHELRYGLALNPVARVAPAVLALLDELRVLPFDSACATQAAQLRASLGRAGQPIGPYDALIAATALTHDLVLVTHNTREFARVPGLKLENCLSD
jgi:tRNA(fMet)-specific endonuclease VapC